MNEKEFEIVIKLQDKGITKQHIRDRLADNIIKNLVDICLRADITLKQEN